MENGEEAPDLSQVSYCMCLCASVWHYQGETKTVPRDLSLDQTLDPRSYPARGLRVYAIALRARYAMSGTDNAYDATGHLYCQPEVLCNVWY
eukprot:1572388-Rhodomonas_salina.1